MRRTKSFYSPVDMEKERLKEELREARRAIFNLMSEEIQRIMDSYMYCKSSAEGRVWRTKIVGALVGLSEIVSPQTEYSPARGICPMCRRGPNSNYLDGFAIPEGLWRHLEGFGNVQRCSVFSVLLNRVDERLHERFDEEDKIKEIEKAALKKERLASEVLYVNGPEAQPSLVDDLFFAESRQGDDFAFAEERIKQLGLAINMDDRIKSYTRDYGDSVVYADPRQKGRITFYVYIAEWQPLKNKKHARRPRRDFNIPDSWKHYIRDKYNARLAEARRGLGLPDDAPIQPKVSPAKRKKG